MRGIVSVRLFRRESLPVIGFFLKKVKHTCVLKKKS